MRWIDYRIAERRPGCEGHDVRLQDWMQEGLESGDCRFPTEAGKIAYAGFYLEGVVDDLWRDNEPDDPLWDTFSFGHYRHARDRFLNLWLNARRSIAYDPFIGIHLQIRDLHSFYYGEAARSEFRLYLQSRMEKRSEQADASEGDKP
ncbi:hypothetical protein [Haloferula sp. BvORR071]|uniref:hypothetical protein n=1 Tax=Haloferula sp. BvORR071 TaxID=1396141 RepID=UPI000554C4C0|nr:hypothetical protein [Haloferula sp. BvORR071]